MIVVGRDGSRHELSMGQVDFLRTFLKNNKRVVSIGEWSDCEALCKAGLLGYDDYGTQSWGDKGCVRVWKITDAGSELAMMSPESVPREYTVTSVAVPADVPRRKAWELIIGLDSGNELTMRFESRSDAGRAMKNICSRVEDYVCWVGRQRINPNIYLDGYCGRDLVVFAQHVASVEIREVME